MECHDARERQVKRAALFYPNLKDRGRTRARWQSSEETGEDPRTGVDMGEHQEGVQEQVEDVDEREGAWRKGPPPG